jgi:hypothetical protein
MKKILLLLVIIDAMYASAQKPMGFFGKQNTIGVSSSINLFNLSRYGKGSIVIPTIQYTRVRNLKRSYVFEYGRFNVRVKGNNTIQNDEVYLLVEGPVKSGYRYDYAVTSMGTGKVSGNSFSIYSVRNWKNMGQLGGYHSWGLHVASLKYKSDNFRYYFIDDDDHYRDTFFNGSANSKKTVLSASFSLGKKGMLGKSTRLVWDYGIRMRIPITGYEMSSPYFYNDKEYINFQGSRVYAFSTFLTLYAGLHYAL